MKAKTLLGFALAVSACGDPLKPVELVTEPRVLAARVEVNGDPDRASPAPGESANVRWLVAAPDPNPALGWSFQACAAEAGGRALGTCAGEPFAQATQDTPATGEPNFDFDTPAAIDAQELVISGAICPGGAPIFGSEGVEDCSGDLALSVSLELPLEQGDVENRNPRLRPENIMFDAAAWPAGTDCTALPVVAPGSKHGLEITLDDSDRDALVPRDPADPTREALQLSHFTTGGELERAFTAFDSNASDLRASLSWTAPKSAPESGTVRFFIVVRDFRGGSDFTERSLCF